MENLKILSDKRYDEIGKLALRNEERKMADTEAIKLHSELISILKDSKEVRDLLDEWDCSSSLVGSIENEIYYEQGFKDALTFIMGKVG